MFSVNLYYIFIMISRYLVDIFHYMEDTEVLSSLVSSGVKKRRVVSQLNCTEMWVERGWVHLLRTPV
jgi:hypothetical protein